MLHLSATRIGAVKVLQQGIDSRRDASLVNNNSLSSPYPPYAVAV